MDSQDKKFYDAFTKLAIKKLRSDNSNILEFKETLNYIKRYRLLCGYNEDVEKEYLNIFNLN